MRKFILGLAIAAAASLAGCTPDQIDASANAACKAAVAESGLAPPTVAGQAAVQAVGVVCADPSASAAAVDAARVAVKNAIAKGGKNGG